MRHRKGFTLVETIIASAIIVIVLTALVTAAHFFAKGHSRIDDRRSALIIANAEISRFDRIEELPDVGVTTRSDTLAGSEYSIRNSVIQTADGSLELLVTVTAPGGSSVDLVRRYYR